MFMLMHRRAFTISDSSSIKGEYRGMATEGGVIEYSAVGQHETRRLTQPSISQLVVSCLIGWAVAERLQVRMRRVASALLALVSAG